MEEQLLEPEDSISSFSGNAMSEDKRNSMMGKKILAGGAIMAAAIAAIGAFLFGYSLGFTSPTLTAMEVLKHGGAFTDGDLKDLGDDTIVVVSDQAAQFSSIVNVGAMIGALLGGVACDSLGRRGTLILIAPVFALAYVWTALTGSYVALISARVITGIAVGVVSMAVPLYISETAPTNLRGTLGSVNQFALTTGILVSYLLGILATADQTTAIECTVPMGVDEQQGESTQDPSICLNDGKTITDTECDDFVSGWDCKASNTSATMMVGYCTGELPHWRFLAWVASLVAGLLFTLILLMPESPPWLLKVNQEKRARRALMFLRSQSDLHVDFEIKELERSLLKEGTHTALNNDDNDNNYDEKDDALAAGIGSLEREREGTADFFGCKVLFADDMKRPMMMGFAMMIFQQLSGVNAVIFYSGTILQSAGMDNPNLGATIIAAMQVLFTGVAVALMDRAGRRILMSASSIGMALAAFCMAGFFINHKKPAWLALTALIVYIASFSLGMGPVPWLYMGEIFPAHARSKACSAATLLNWLGGFFVTFLFDRAQVTIGPSGCFIVFGSICVLCLAFVLSVMPETKGKSFEQIQAEFQAASEAANANADR